MNKVLTYKFIVILISTLLMFFITEKAFITSMKSVEIDNIGKINKVMRHGIDVNISIWGSSTALSNFNPKMLIDSLHMSAFNMGIDGTNIDQYNGLTKEYLSYTKHSKYLIITIDAHGGLVKREKLYDTHNWIHHISNKNINNALSGVDQSTMQKINLIPFYKLTLYNNHSLHLFISNFTSTFNENSKPNFGFRKNFKKIPPDFNKDVEGFDAIINEQVFMKLKEICTSASEKNIQPIVVITPCFDKGLNKIKKLDEFTKKVTSLNKNNVIVFNFLTTDFSSNPSLFKDNTHLNFEGANKLTELLIKSVREL